MVCPDPLKVFVFFHSFLPLTPWGGCYFISTLQLRCRESTWWPRAIPSAEWRQHGIPRTPGPGPLTTVPWFLHIADETRSVRAMSILSYSTEPLPFSLSITLGNWFCCPPGKLVSILHPELMLQKSKYSLLDLHAVCFWVGTTLWFHRRAWACDDAGRGLLYGAVYASWTVGHDPQPFPSRQQASSLGRCELAGLLLQVSLLLWKPMKPCDRGERGSDNWDL